MKHLCIINPMAGQIYGRVNELLGEIKGFFARNPRMKYAIHVTRWKRDASGFVMRYVSNASEMIRVYVFGGGGTLFEVINGVMGLPNVQVAYYPLGRDDDLINVFGNDARSKFTSMMNLALSPVISIDTILSGNHYAVSNILIGLEAVSYRGGIKLSEQIKLPLHLGYYIAGYYYTLIKPVVQRYHIEIDGVEMDDNYLGVFIGNISSHGAGSPVPEARFNDGYIDVSIIKPVPKRKLIGAINDYQSGHYEKWPEYIAHHRCRELRITSPLDMVICIDGEFFYDTEMKFKINPTSLNLVCPSDIAKAVLISKESDALHQAEDVDILSLLANGE